MYTRASNWLDCIHYRLTREGCPTVGELDECDVVLEGRSRAAVSRVLHEVIREEDLPPGLVAVQVVHAHVRVGTVGAAIKSLGSHGASNVI